MLNLTNHLYGQMLQYRMGEQQRQREARAEMAANVLRDRRNDLAQQRLDLERDQMNAKSLASAAKMAGQEVPELAAPGAERGAQIGEMAGEAAMARMLAESQYDQQLEATKIMGRLNQEEYKRRLDEAGLRRLAEQKGIKVPEGDLGTHTSMAIRDMLRTQMRFELGFDHEGQPLSFSKIYRHFNEIKDDDLAMLMDPHNVKFNNVDKQKAMMGVRNLARETGAMLASGQLKNDAEATQYYNQRVGEFMASLAHGPFGVESSDSSSEEDEEATPPSKKDKSAASSSSEEEELEGVVDSIEK